MNIQEVTDYLAGFLVMMELSGNEDFKYEVEGNILSIYEEQMDNIYKDRINLMMVCALKDKLVVQVNDFNDKKFSISKIVKMILNKHKVEFDKSQICKGRDRNIAYGSNYQFVIYDMKIAGEIIEMIVNGIIGTEMS